MTTALRRRVPLAAAALALALPASLAAQKPAPVRIPVLREADGSEVWVDSASVVHSGGGRYVVRTVIQLPSPAPLEDGTTFDRQEQRESLDCEAGRAWRHDAKLYLADSLLVAGGREEGWSPVPADRRPLFDAVCRALAGSFAASLPVEPQLTTVDEPPSLINAPAVARALLAERRTGRNGTVTLRFRLGADGVPEPASVVIENTPDPDLGPPATRVVLRMRFAPARIRGTAVPVWVTLPVTFQ